MKTFSAFDCPSLQNQANKMIGGGVATNHALGIGINFPEIGTIWKITTGPAPGAPYKQTQVTMPSQCIGWADAGSVTSASLRNGEDNWLPDAAFDAVLNQFWGGGAAYFRAPSDSTWTAGDALSLPRHNKRANFLFMDGHVETKKNSSQGLKLPRTDSGALWARDHSQ